MLFIAHDCRSHDDLGNEEFLNALTSDVLWYADQPNDHMLAGDLADTWCGF